MLNFFINFVKKSKNIVYLHKTPFFVQKLFSNFVWKSTNNQNVIYLTFDDGPIPEVTEWVLKELKKFQAKATFFCVGENIRNYPQILLKIKEGGHQIGNHTFNHLRGTSTKNDVYFSNIAKCQMQIRELTHEKGLKLFRPPYGRLKFSQMSYVIQNYKVVMWDVLSGDFDSKLSPENCLKNTIKATKAGSIVVFHDNIKTFETLKHVLPLFLQHFYEKGFRFETIQ